MTQVFELHDVTKRFGKKVVLDHVSLSVSRRSIVGLIGRNGSGKTTLLRHITGLYLPTDGSCTTLGCDTRALGARELSRIGMMNQHDKFIEWMTVREFLGYLESFYERWDSALQAELIEKLDVDADARVGTLSPGNAQKVGLIASTCHHPELLLLDEPLSDLDPIVRAHTVSMLLERFSDEELTLVISSHLLHDIEKIVDRIICLDSGKVVADMPLDELRESYAEWVVASPSGALPAMFDEEFVLSAAGDGHHARLEVRHSEPALREFTAAHDAEITVRPLSLERIFGLMVGQGREGTR